MKTNESLCFEIAHTSEKGKGVFARRPIQFGELVMRGYIEKFLDRNTSHASQIGENIYVLHGGIMPIINHSCDPNCGIRVNETGAHDLVAFRDIAVGEELSYDYAMRNYLIEHFPKKCSCGSSICRGQVKGWKYLDHERKVAYWNFSAPFLHELDNRYGTAIDSKSTLRV